MKKLALVFASAIATTFAASAAFAQDVAATATTTLNAAVGSTLGWVALGVGIMMGIAVLGGTLGQARAASTALDGIARNPAASGKFLLPLVLALALMESLVLFAFIIGLGMQGSVVEVLKTLVK
jgi:F-type H+-transporting ATPase subunit c